jgi:hypothetical protein
MLVDIGAALFAFGIVALVLEHFPLAMAAFGAALYCVA